MKTLTIRDIPDILRFLDRSCCEEVFLRAGGVSVRARKIPDVSPSPPAGRLVAVKAPRLGIFQRSAGTKGPPLAEAGREVFPATPVGFLRVLETSYPVLAGLHGRIVRYCAGEGRLVEYGEELLVVSPAEAAQVGGKR